MATHRTGSGRGLKSATGDFARVRRPAVRARRLVTLAALVAITGQAPGGGSTEISGDSPICVQVGVCTRGGGIGPMPGGSVTLVAGPRMLKFPPLEVSSGRAP